MKFRVEPSNELFYDKNGNVDPAVVDSIIDKCVSRINDLSDDKIKSITESTMMYQCSSKDYLYKLPTAVKQGYDYWKKVMTPAFTLLHALSAQDIVDKSQKWIDFLKVAEAATKQLVEFKKSKSGMMVPWPKWSNDLCDMLRVVRDTNAYDEKKSMFDLGYRSKEDILALINAANCMFSTKGISAKCISDIYKVMDYPKIKQLVRDLYKLEKRESDDLEYGMDHYGPIAFIYSEFGECATEDVQRVVFEACFSLEEDFDAFLKQLDVSSSKPIWKKILKILLFPFYKG